MWSSRTADVGLKRKRKHAEPGTDDRFNLEKLEGPNSVEDLVTHTRKIAEVKDLLTRVDRRPAMILLSGPAGSCKTVTLKLVAKSLGIDIQEWVNPLDKVDFGGGDNSVYDPGSYHEPNQKEKFESYVFRCSRYSTLFCKESRRIILIEDFPNYLIREPTKFIEFLYRYKEIGQCPIVFICTEDEKLNISHDLFPPDVRSALKIENIKFNPVSHTALMKILRRYGSSSSKVTLENIAQSCNGDIRAALSALRFMQVGSAKSRNIEHIGKDISTDYYRCLGRILYPKRLGETECSGRNFLYNINEISEYYNSNTLNMLHENFLNTFSSLKDVINGTDVFSECDILSVGGDELKGYVALSAVAGLMCANKKPNKGTFKPMVRSRFAGLQKYDQRSTRRYPEFGLSNRIVNLDLIPYITVLPSFAAGISSFDADRFPSSVSAKRVHSSQIFKVPKPVKRLDDVDEELLIEEFDD